MSIEESKRDGMVYQLPLTQRATRVYAQGVQNIDRGYAGPPSITEAKQNPNWSYFIDALIISKNTVAVLFSEERTAPERTYRMDGETLSLILPEAEYYVEGRQPFLPNISELANDAANQQ